MAGQNNAPLPDGLELSGYRIVKKIAVGGFSIVYLAEDSDGHAVAIKEYMPAALATREPGQLHPSIPAENIELYRIGLKCFFDEGRVLARIVHPHVVNVLNFFRAHDTVYMVMGYEHGRSLQDHIDRRRQKGDKPLVSEIAIHRLFMQIMDALREVHTHKLLHLDLKPANIFLRADGTPILLDFGAARQTLHADLSRLYPMYTPGFAPPELITRKDLGPWTDIYSIGASLFTCMVGVPPQSAHERKEHDRMEGYYQQMEGVYSSGLINLMRWCLMTDPLQRPQSVFALQKSMRKLVVAAHGDSGLLSRLLRLVH